MATENQKYILTPAQREVPDLAWVDRYSRLLDNRFRVPGTNIRFGLDFLMGLVPYAGDIFSLVMSGMLISTMAKHGASGMLVARMLFNVAIDATVGTIPLVGDLFDLGYKANVRNLRLMREYYEEGRHQGSAWPVIIVVVIIIIALIVAVAWVAWWVLSSVLAAIGG